MGHLGKKPSRVAHRQVQPRRVLPQFELKSETRLGHEPHRQPKRRLDVLWLAGNWDTASCVRCHSRHRLCVSFLLRCASAGCVSHADRYFLSFRDLWVAGSDCSIGCSGITTFTTSDSSTFTNLSTSFSITYGSGEAAGALGEDTVQMAGFSVSNQTFGKS